MKKPLPTTKIRIVLRTILSAGVLAVLLLAGMAAGAWDVYSGDSIQDAVDGAGLGDIIYVHAGTYVENVEVNKELTLIGDDADVVTVQAADDRDRVFEVRGNWVNISGFTVSGATATYYVAGIYLSNANHCNISNNNVSDNYGGISLSSSNNTTLQNNIMSGNTYNLRVWGNSLSDYTHSIDISNMVDGKPVYYWVDQQDRQIPEDAGFVGVVNSKNITVRDLTPTKNHERGVVCIHR